ncbi:MAG: (d)CMP kinase [Acidimicrobiia bacterium]
MVITIDGPSGVGKSTVAQGVADALAIGYLDTGATYRAATLATIRAEVDVTDATAVFDNLSRHTIDYDSSGVLLDGVSVADEVRAADVTANVSAVSAHVDVRAAIVAIQRRWVTEHGGRAVVEGRDIGTVVFPDAPVKIYLTASPEVRAERRAGDREAAGISVDEIASALAARDRADSTRTASPLRPADDAVTIDTSSIGVDDVIAEVLRRVANT